jgi:hypothetical protein
LLFWHFETITLTWLPAAGEQGDQIGRNFAHWVVVYFGQFLKISKIAHLFGLFLHG